MPAERPVSGRRFAPRPWAWLVFVPLFALLCTLGTWQLRRGLAKQDLMDRYAAVSGQAAQALGPADLAVTVPGGVHARLVGAYVDGGTWFLDNQSHEGRPGYHVWSVWQLGGERLMVDRGWRPLEGDTSGEDVNPPATSSVSGLWQALPRPGLRLGSSSPCELGLPRDRRLQYPTVEDLDCLKSGRFLNGVLRLDPDEPGGFVRDWRVAVEVPPSRHYGYAAQWYAFAATLLFLFVRLNLVKR